MTQDAVLTLMQGHGLWLVGPMAVIEGPIVTVIAAYLAKLGYMNIWAVYAVCVLGAFARALADPSGHDTGAQAFAGGAFCHQGRMDHFAGQMDAFCRLGCHAGLGGGADELFGLYGV